MVARSVRQALFAVDGAFFMSPEARGAGALRGEAAQGNREKTSRYPSN
jgi:hypothetical protein